MFFRLSGTLHQSTREAQIEAAVMEEWEAISQEWVNQLIPKHCYWVL